MKARAVLQGIERILDAETIDTLLAGDREESGLLYALLRDCAHGAAARSYPTIRRVAARRGITARYIADRAEVLLASAEERCTSDLYRILGVPALAPADLIRARWRQVVKECHPDRGAMGEPSRFRATRAAYDVLRDAEQRADYERLWQASVAPIERARAAASAAAAELAMVGRAPARPRALRTLGARLARVLRVPEQRGVSERGPAQPMPASARDERGGSQAVAPSTVAASGNGDRPESVLVARAAPWCKRREEEPTMEDVLRRTGLMIDAVHGINRRLAGVGVDGVGAVAELYERLQAALAAVPIEELDATLADIDRASRALAAMSRDLGRLRQLKQTLGGAQPSLAAAGGSHRTGA